MLICLKSVKSLIDRRAAEPTEATSAFWSLTAWMFVYLCVLKLLCGCSAARACVRACVWGKEISNISVMKRLISI